MQAFEVVTRLGFAARGLMYAAIGWLAFASGRTEDTGGILAYLESHVGGILVAVMAGERADGDRHIGRPVDGVPVSGIERPVSSAMMARPWVFDVLPWSVAMPSVV